MGRLEDFRSGVKDAVAAMRENSFPVVENRSLNVALNAALGGFTLAYEGQRIVGRTLGRVVESNPGLVTIPVNAVLYGLVGVHEVVQGVRRFVK